MLARFLLRGSYVLVSWTAAPVPQVQAPLAETLLVERAVARYAGALDLFRPFGYEEGAQEFGTPHEPTGPVLALYRTQEHSNALAQDLGARAVRFPAVTFCGELSPIGCVQTVFRIGVPVVAGDSATVWLYCYSVSKGDGSAEETDLELLLVKRDSRWSVAKKLRARFSQSH